MVSWLYLSHASLDWFFHLNPLPKTIQTKNISSTQVIFCTPLKMLWKAKALIMILLSYASVCTMQLQQSQQGRCSGPETGCDSRPWQNGVYFCCSAPAYFLVARSRLCVGVVYDRKQSVCRRKCGF